MFLNYTAVYRKIKDGEKKNADQMKEKRGVSHEKTNLVYTKYMVDTD